MTCEKCGRKIPVDTKPLSVSELFSDIANGRNDYCHECGVPWPLKWNSALGPPNPPRPKYRNEFGG